MTEVWRRETGRVIPLDKDGRALLMHGFEPLRPDQPYWFSIGGGLEPGEDTRAAAVRELREETGVVLDAEHLVGPVVTDVVEFSWNGRHVEQAQEIYTCRLQADVALSLAGLEPGEIGNVDGVEWVSLDALRAAGQQIEGADLVAYVERCARALDESPR